MYYKLVKVIINTLTLEKVILFVIIKYYSISNFKLHCQQLGLSFYYKTLVIFLLFYWYQTLTFYHFVTTNQQPDQTSKMYNWSIFLSFFQLLKKQLSKIFANG